MFAAQTLTRPAFTDADVRALCRERYGLSVAEVSELSSFQDQNFKVTDEAGRRFVFRVDNPGWPASALDLQNAAMAHLLAKDATFPIARLVPGLSGEMMPRVTRDGAAFPLRVFTFLPGRLLARVSEVSDDLARNLGRVAGTLSRHLGDFGHPGTDRISQWDFQHAPRVVGEFLPFVADRALRADIERTLRRFEADNGGGLLLPQLRRSFVHGDLTGYNVLVDRRPGEDWRVSGVVDFGDMTHSYTLSEIAVVLAEGVMNRAAHPLAAAAEAVRAYHAVYPLTEAELAALFHFVCIRLCVTLTSECQQLSLEPDNAYVREVFEIDRRMFRTLLAVDPAHAHATFRHACGQEPNPQAAESRQWLSAHRAEFASVVDVPIEAPPPVVDLSPASELWRDGGWMTAQACRRAVSERLRDGYGLGRYGEARLMYSQTNSAAEPGTVHLGVDVFAPAGTPVRAPFEGVIERIEGNRLCLRHGPGLRVVLGRIQPSVRAGERVARGQTLGAVAEAATGEPLPAHLHCQLDLRGPGEPAGPPLPALIPPGEREVWLSLCPDPNLVLGFANLQPAPFTPATDMAARRFRTIPRSQEFYYERAPVQIVRGWRQYLIDSGGRAYLDCINNVAHVGHSHPHVNAAAARQMARLNTNSRFLYASMLNYSERLLALLPEPLQVVFFVCSGSEANDLALRLARAYTGQHDVIVIDGEYHGNTTATYEISTSLLDNPAEGKAAREYIHLATQPNLFHGPYRFGDPQAAVKYADSVRARVERIRSKGRRPAAFFTEALLGSSGGIDLPNGYLPAAYAIVREAGGVCIADEVQVGFGRVGSHWWAFEAQGVVPDIVTLGKPMGNGHPVSAVVTTPAIADAFARATTYFSTFGGNPVSCEVGLAVLEVMEREGLRDNAREVGRYFKTALTQLMDVQPMIGAVYGMGLYMGVELVRDRASAEPATEEAMRVADRMKQRGIIVYPTGDHYNILKLKPPLVFSRADADFFAGQLAEVLSGL
jgi:4-aminobutyrate aminotransferase-like enzyme/Ser/Thr protein kinase RdoA (MazF antagonist)